MSEVTTNIPKQESTSSTSPKPTTVFTRAERQDRPNRSMGDRRRSAPAGSGPAANSGNRTDRPNGGGNRGPRGDRPAFGKNRRDQRQDQVEEMESAVIEVRRVTRVVKGGKRMRFSALVVVGDREGRVGMGLKKGADFQDAVSKATKQAQGSCIKVKMNDDKSISFVSNNKFKSCEVFLKPAKAGTGLIAGGFVRPVLELAGIQNVYSKINRSRNKIVGVRCVIEALKQYKA